MHAYQPERLKSKSSRIIPMLDGLLKHPRLCAGAALSVAVMGAIFVNAVWYQPGKHPAPLFATRMPDDAAKPNVRMVKLKRMTPANSTKKETVAKEQSGELLREVQTALSVRGYYGGKLDGLYGSRTKRAISAFQKDHSLNQDGMVSVRLLTQVLLSASSRPQEVPVPKPTQLVKRPDTVKVVKAIQTSPEAQATQATLATPAALADGLVARIQAGLRAYGYDDLVVDGHMGQQTATAIQRFQLDYGMKITGEPSDVLLKKLSDIGAYRQG